MQSAHVSKALATAIAFAASGGFAGVGHAQTPAPTDTFGALAMADGPTPADRLSLTFRGTNASDVVANAVRSCYAQAAPGYMHTCQIWYGTAWVVGTACRQSASDVRFAIGDDRVSPEAAATKAIAHLRDVDHADVSNCRVVAQVNADAMQVARSTAKDRPH